MTRADLLKSPNYWTASIQAALYGCAEKYMAENGMNRSQLAEYLGVSKGYVSQLLNGDYDHKISKLADLALKFNVVPHFDFRPVQSYIEEDAQRWAQLRKPRVFTESFSCKTIVMQTGKEYFPLVETEEKAA